MGVGGVVRDLVVKLARCKVLCGEVLKQNELEHSGRRADRADLDRDHLACSQLADQQLRPANDAHA